MPFRGFSDAELDDVDSSDLYPVFLCLSELAGILEQLSHKMGGRIMSTVRHTDQDKVAGRDYFFDQIEARRRGAQNPHIVGFFHYRSPEERRGSWFEVWRSPHDDEPRLRKALPELVAEAREAYASGHSQQWVDDLAYEVRKARGL